MRKSFYFPISTLALFIVCIGFEGTAYSQDTDQDIGSSQSVLLPQGCQLALDPRLELDDSISVEIINGIREVLPKIQSLIPADSVTITLEMTNEPFLVLSEWGVGGVANSPHLASVYFDPDNPNFKVEYLIQGLSHELYHASRCRVPRFYMSLLELFINDGLADQFMVEVFKCEQGPPFLALSEEQTLHYMNMVKPIIRDRLHSWYDCVPWFWGRSGDEPIPRWTGFAIGSKIVKDYLKEHPEARASSLVLTSAEEIVSSTPELKYETQPQDDEVTSIDKPPVPETTYGSFTDTRDGNTYKTIQIGNQIWMAENLNYETDHGSWVYDSDNSHSSTCGRLYNWEAAHKACPGGWHLPSDEEWRQLEMYLDMSQADADTFGLRGANVGTKLKSTGGWNSGGEGTNECYFSALPAGYRFANGSFYDIGYTACFWSSTASAGTRAWFRSLGCESGDVGRNAARRSFGFSVRCVKD
jgi:uncharacterized protein (TIGR02145 family)